MAPIVRTLGVLGVIALCGCPGSTDDGMTPSGSTHLESCDPLAPNELPIKLQTIIAAGKDESGTIYVADRTSESEERIFVSRDNTLYRKRVSGSGSNGTSDFTWVFDNDGKAERLVVRKQADEVTGIALAPADQRKFFDQLDDSAQKLTPVDPASLTGFAVRNLAGDVVVEFVADADNDARLVVMRPKDDWSYEDFRLFYGTNGHLAERVTTQTGPRSYRAFDFIVDGATWHVTFASSLAPAIKSEIDTGDETLQLTLVEPAVPSSNDSFECLVGH